jgi:hypothetical protein
VAEDQVDESDPEAVIEEPLNAPEEAALHVESEP